MRDFYVKIVVLLFVCSTSGSYGQQGPGGVSVESPTLNACGGAASSTCGLWLDASTLSLANGADVTNWPDVSFSETCDDAISPNSIHPIYRNDPAGTINGLPTITFNVGQHFILNSSDDMNLESVTYDKMVFLAFRTSEDVTSKQTIYEEGGTVRGFNIMIHNGIVIVGAYDKQVDNDGGVGGTSDNTPAWGYSYVSRTVQPNTTYILTAQFRAATFGVIGNNSNYYLQGWLNGEPFGGPGNLVSDGSYSGFPGNARVGTLYDHPNPCGLGAVNDDTVDRQQVLSNNSGSWPFKGKLAEVCYFKDSQNESQRVIVENYLASKYVASLVQNDFYAYEFLMGKDLIGVGRLTNSGPTHTLSQGRNPFRVTAQSLSPSANQFCFIGHNGINATWTDAGVPENSANIQRLERIWRVDRENFNSQLTFEVDEDKLPAPPSGYNSSNAKLVLLIDQTSQFIPDFTKESTIVREMFGSATAPFDYQENISFTDGAFFTFAWLRPEVNLTESVTFELEDDPAPASFTAEYEVQLNYQPLGNVGGYDVIYTVEGITAVRGVDFDFGDGAQLTDTINIPVNMTSEVIPVEIINDDIAEDPSTEEFEVILLSGEPSLTVGASDTLNVTIYDDDPTPKFTFAAPTSIVNEDVGTHTITILRTGDTDGPAQLRVRRINGSTTARWTVDGLDPVDFYFDHYQYVYFVDGQSSATVDVTIYDDDIDEENSEYIRLNITSISGAGAGDYLNHDIEVVDNDVPLGMFGSPTQSGYETQSAPSLLVTLSNMSSRVVTVGFTMSAGSATLESDFDGDLSGFVIFEPFTDEGFIGPFFVYTDALVENPETVIFNLTETTPEGGTPIVTIDDLIYTIIDYAEFEWKGIAGVGQLSDNIIWIDATQESVGNAASLANRSPYALSISQANNPATVVANGINNQQALDFNGSTTASSADAYEIENSDKINTAGTVDKLSYFFVFQADDVPSTTTTGSPNTTHARLIYEQGGGTRGTSIYLYNNRLRFHAWNNANDDGGDNAATTDTIEGNQAPWGHNGNRTNSVLAFSSQDILPNTPYVVSCHYSNFSNEPLMVYVNGVKGTMTNETVGYNQFGVGRLWGHAGLIGLGAPINATRFHFWNGNPSDRQCAFDGKIGEFISYHEPGMNEARRVIIENYLAAKFEIDLTGGATPQIWDLTDLEQANFANQIAGVGEAGDASESHTNSEGPGAIFQVKTDGDEMSADSYLMWGHNGESLTDTWPYSFPNASLPSPVRERSAQVWKIFEEGSVSEMDVLINFSASDNADTLTNFLPNTYLKLLTHSNTDPQDFSNASVYNAFQINSGGVAEFRNVPVSNGMYVALGNTSDYFNSPLPIELLNFDARLNEPVVNIDWSTATETNNDYFVVERAGDDLVWKPLMQVQGAGNSSSTISYHEVDREPLNGVSYYRLKQVDFDGHFEYSDVVSVVRTHKQAENDLYLFPNPSSIGSVYVTLPEHKSDELVGDLSMFEISGKKVWEERAAFNGGQFVLNYGDLPSGIYLIQLQTQDLNLTKKLVIR